MAEKCKNYKNVEKNKIFRRQLVLCSVSSLFDILCGLTISAPTVIIAQLRNEANSTHDITDENTSWASSACHFAGVLWVLVLTTMAHFIGRKRTLIFLNTILFFTFINLYYTVNMKWVVINQALLGINSAGLKTVFIMLITEYASLQSRGIFLTFKVAGYFWGVWISNALGTFFHWSSIGLFGIICTIYLSIALFIVPESPYWLARNGKYDECTLTHRWLKGKSVDAEKELRMLVASRVDKFKKDPPYAIGRLRMVLKPENYKPVLCCILLQCLQAFTGKLGLIVYAIDILRTITGNDESAYKWMLILDGFTVFGMYLASVLIKITTRKRLLLSGSFVSMFFLFFMSIYLYLVRYSVVTDKVYVTLTLLVFYSTSVCCGPIVSANVTVGELLPVSSSISVILTAMCLKMIVGIDAKVSFYIYKYFDNHGAFLFYAIIYCIALLCTNYYVPETKNKTLNEITKYFKANRPRDSDQENCHERDDILLK